MSPPSMISACLQAWQAQDLSQCKPMGLDAATWIALLSALGAVVIFTTRLIIRRTRGRERETAYVRGSLGRTRFNNLCRRIKPLSDENYRIFSTFGPNGGRGDGAPKQVRHELGVWYETRAQIVVNNGKIRSLITTNWSAIPQSYRPTFNRWLDHIDAFHAHVLNAAADYRDHQFPREVVEIVKRHA